jgi:hypothetical protein
MPSIAKGSKKGKGAKGGSKKGAVKLVPDPDAAYKQQLDEKLYLSRPTRAKLSNQYTSAVDTAIKANIVSGTSTPTGEFSMPKQILLLKMPEIVRSLGLCVTDDQVDQICCMVSQAAPPSEAPADAANRQEAASQETGAFADTERVRQVLSDIMHTHVLAYDPQVLLRPDPRFPARVSSVVYKVSESDLVSCFETLWDATGKNSVIRSDGSQVRCFNMDELEAMMGGVQKQISSVQPLTKKELDDLYFFVKGEGSDVIGEDTFLSCFADVK